MEQTVPVSRPRWLGLAVVAATVVAVPVQAGELAFAYADAAGKQLLAPRELAGAPRVQQALCPGNELLALKFIKTQTGDTGRDTGRASSENFTRQAGQRFSLVDGKVAEGDVCLLAPPAFFRTREPLPYEPLLAREDQRDACSEAVRGRIASARKRALAGCWPVATIGDDEGVYAVLFERRGADVLAALVLDGGGRLAFRDYPGNTRDETSVWRVDDGGVFDPGAFDILFVIEGREGVELGVEWAGTEGANVTLLQADGALLRERLAAYFYRAP